MQNKRSGRKVLYLVFSVAVIAIVGAGIYLSSPKNTEASSSTTSLPSINLTISPLNPVLGSKDAPITIFEFGDFQCPSCGYWFKTQEKQVVKNLIDTGKAKFVWIDFDFYGPDSTSASEAAYAAGEQGKFWEFHDLLYSNQGAPNDGWASRENLAKFAQRLGLNMTKFNQDFNGDKYRQLVKSNFDLGGKLGVEGTPTFFVVGPNGKSVKIVGSQPYEVFEKAANSLLRG
ncbi:MAG: DsbA family protein [Thaumarchaeota archaeon]|nr:DsbA family protein [Nitrososphaerota archaeon]